jgi:UDP-GlcNAc:undecaprenyl-phosphate GlcNAc-1-phosphate transferase
MQDFMMYDLFLMPFLFSFVSTVLIVVAMLLFLRRFHFENRRVSKRHIHTKGVIRFGGAAIISAFLIGVLLDGHLVVDKPLLGILIASIFIVIFGILDDIKQLSWKTQLALQLFLSTFVFFAGVRLQFVTNPFGGIYLFDGSWGTMLSFFVAICWIVFLMNAMNWVDGVDGVSSGVSVVAASTIFFLVMRPEVNQPPIGIIVSIFVGCLLGFLFFNFHPSKILAGTSGSMFMGFVLAVLAIFSGAKMVTTLLVLVVPVIDAFWVVGERYWSGSSIFSPDRRHLHYRLLELGWSQKMISVFYWGITLLVSIIALNTRSFEKVFALFLVVLLMLVFLMIVRSKVLQKNKLQP